MGRGGEDPPAEAATGEGHHEGAAKKEHTIHVVHSAMPSSYEKDAIEVFVAAMDKYRNYKDMATFVKKEYDRRYPSSGKSTDGVYHCICGSHFAGA